MVGFLPGPLNGGRWIASRNPALEVGTSSLLDDLSVLWIQLNGWGLTHLNESKEAMLNSS